MRLATGRSWIRPCEQAPLQRQRRDGGTPGSGGNRRLRSVAGPEGGAAGSQRLVVEMAPDLEGNRPDGGGAPGEPDRHRLPPPQGAGGTPRGQRGGGGGRTCRRFGTPRAPAILSEVQIRLGRLPVPGAVLVLTGDGSAVPGPTGRPVIVVPAVFARLVAPALVVDRSATGRGGRRRRRRREWGRRRRR